MRSRAQGRGSTRGSGQEREKSSNFEVFGAGTLAGRLVVSAISSAGMDWPSGMGGQRGQRAGHSRARSVFTVDPSFCGEPDKNSILSFSSPGGQPVNRGRQRRQLGGGGRKVEGSGGGRPELRARFSFVR